MCVKTVLKGTSSGSYLLDHQYIALAAGGEGDAARHCILFWALALDRAFWKGAGRRQRLQSSYHHQMLQPQCTPASCCEPPDTQGSASMVPPTSRRSGLHGGQAARHLSAGPQAHAAPLVMRLQRAVQDCGGVQCSAWVVASGSQKVGGWPIHHSSLRLPCLRHSHHHHGNHHH